MEVLGRQLRARCCEGFWCNRGSPSVKSRRCDSSCYGSASFLLFRPFNSTARVVGLFPLSSQVHVRGGGRTPPERPRASLCFLGICSGCSHLNPNFSKHHQGCWDARSCVFSCLLTHAGSETQAGTEIEVRVESAPKEELASWAAVVLGEAL